MGSALRIKLTDLQPSQLYICSEKLSIVASKGSPRCPDDIDPVPIKKLGSRVVLTDGHTRVFAAFQAGLNEIVAYWDTDELDWEAYQICVDWCIEHDIHSIADLKNRVVSQGDYEELWHKRCHAMHKELDDRRGAAQNTTGTPGY